MAASLARAVMSEPEKPVHIAVSLCIHCIHVGRAADVAYLQ